MRGTTEARAYMIPPAAKPKGRSHAESSRSRAPNRPTPCGTRVTSTFSKRPLRCTLKVILPSRVYEPRQPEESLLRRTKPRPRTPGARVLHEGSGLEARDASTAWWKRIECHRAQPGVEGLPTVLSVVELRRSCASATFRRQALRWLRRLPPLANNTSRRSARAVYEHDATCGPPEPRRGLQYRNGSCSVISRSSGALTSRAEGTSSTPSGHLTPMSGSSYLMPRSIEGS
jgi:hypothetical protein